MSLWYQTPFNSRNPRLIQDTLVRCRDKYITLERYHLVQPIRKYYLPQDCWLRDFSWREDEEVACYNEKYGGFYLVPLKAIDFKG
jgi:hypothetical protein